MTDAAITYLIKQHPWMNYGQAMALVVDCYERFKDQKKYFGEKNVATLSAGNIATQDPGAPLRRFFGSITTMDVAQFKNIKNITQATVNQ